MHLMMITQTREQVSVQVISTLALQVQLKHKELNLSFDYVQSK